MKPSSVFVADFIYYTIWAAALLFVMGPYFLMRIHHAPEVWQWAAMALGVLLLVFVFWVVGVARRRFPQTFEFIGAAHKYAKKHRELSLEAKNLTALEYACFGSVLILVVGAAIASAVLLINVAAFNAGSYRLAAVIAASIASVLILIPVLMTGARIGYYLGLRMAARISR